VTNCLSHGILYILCCSGYNARIYWTHHL
jgi:hypothetical protein